MDTVILPDQCPVCGGTVVKHWIRKQNLDVFLCDDCTAGFRYPMPSMKDLRVLYSEELFNAPGRREYYFEDISTAAANARNALRCVRKYHSGIQTLFDAGCGFGHFLKVARDTAGLQVKGCELSEFAVEHARSRYDLEIEHCSVTEWASGECFDVITMWDVIEHLTDPVQAVMHLAERLNKGGLLVISTGDRCSAAAQLFGKSWSILNPEQHLYYFNRKSLDLILERAGLKRIAIHRTHRLFNCRYLAMKVRENIKLLSGLGAIGSRLLPAGLCLPINFGDIFVIIAVKR